MASKRLQPWPWLWRRHLPFTPTPPAAVGSISAKVGARVVRATGRRLGDYSAYVAVEMLSRMRQEARPLAGLRVLHLSAGPFGSNAADMLSAAVPVQQDLGIRAEWRVLRATPETEWLALYEGLSGGLAPGWNASEQDQATAPAFDIARECMDRDVVVVHDPQLVSLVNLVPRASTARWLWHCHLDLRTAQPNLLTRLVRDLRRYHGVITGDPSYLPEHLGPATWVITDPVIDPCSQRCKPLAPRLQRELLLRLQVDPDRPIVGQFAPIGHRYASMAAVGAYWLARQSVPDLQLVLADISVASPESRLLDDQPLPSERQEVLSAVGDDPDVHVLSAAEGMSPIEANALQNATTIALQMAMPRGIAIGLLECQWKRKPSVVGRFGQLPEQVGHGRAGAVTEGAPDAADWIRHLIEHPEIAAAQGQRAHQLAERHLITHCLGGYQRLLRGMTTPRERQPYAS